MIKIKSAEEIQAMKPAGELSKMALRLAGSLAKPGVSTAKIDAAVENLIRSHGGKPAFKGYAGFPASICASVNEQVVHGIPSRNVVLQSGEIISIDTGAEVSRWIGDNAWTFAVGEVDTAAMGLLEVTRDCLRAGIAAAVPGNRIGDIGSAVQELAEKNGYGVVRDFVGHGVGHKMHEDPDVPNYGRRGRGVKLQVGMVIAIEPMICLGSYEVETLSNSWTVVTKDRQLAAHFENTIAITKDGPVVLTADNLGATCELTGGYEL